jgi:hypothetical protein
MGVRAVGQQHELTGLGPRTQPFSDGDPFTRLLQGHSHIQDTRELIAANIAAGGPLQGNNNYYVGGWDGVWKYFQDYSNLLTLGNTGNLAVTFLGSYGLSYNVTGVYNNGTASVQFHVWNASTISSATHPPVLGYTNWWNRNVGDRLDAAFTTGPMSRTEQTVDWTETIRWR